MKAFLIAAIFAAGTAMAEEAVYKGDGLTVRLSQEECRYTQLADALTASGIVGKARTVTVTIRGMDIPGCWGLFGEKVLIADVSGDSGFLMLADFKPLPGV